MPNFHYFIWVEFKDHYGDFDFSPFSYQDIAMKRVLGTEKGKNTNNWTFLGWSFCPTAHSGWQHVLIIFHQNNVSWTKMIILLFHEWRVMEEMMVVNFSSVWKVSRNSHVRESIQDYVTHRCMKAYNWRAKHRQNLCVFINTLVVI